jgi:hypothetical protein
MAHVKKLATELAHELAKEWAMELVDESELLGTVPAIHRHCMHMSLHNKKVVGHMNMYLRVHHIRIAVSYSHTHHLNHIVEKIPRLCSTRLLHSHRNMGSIQPRH